MYKITNSYNKVLYSTNNKDKRDDHYNTMKALGFDVIKK